MRFVLRVVDSDASRELLVECDPATQIDQLTKFVAKAAGRSHPEGMWLEGAWLQETLSVADSGLRDGAVVALDEQSAGLCAKPRVTPLSLLVVAGPDSGRIFPLHAGRNEIGREGDLAIADTSVSRRHAVLTLAGGTITVADLGSKNGTAVDGVPAPRDGQATPLTLGLGQLVALGDSIFLVSERASADAAMDAGEDGGLLFSRPPRLRAADDASRIVVPAAPEKRSNRRIPIAGVLAPLVLGVAMALVMGQMTFLLFAVASPVMALSNALTDRRSNAKQHRAATKEYEEKLADARSRLAQTVAEEGHLRRATHPDPATALLIATLPGRRLWERRRSDADSLSLRIGLANLPTLVQIDERAHPGGDASALGAGDRLVRDVPATLSLRDFGVLGIAGKTAGSEGLARWLVLQLAVFHAPRDLGLTVLAPGRRSAWAWTRWLPHVRTDTVPPAMSVGNDNDTIAMRIAELSSLVKSRHDMAGQGGRRSTASFPAHVVLIDGARSLRAIPGLPQVLESGPEVAVFAICIDREERFLPEECSAVVTVDPDALAYVHVRRSGAESDEDVLADQVSETLADTIARSLAPIREVGADDEEESTLPSSVRLLDVLGLEPPTPEEILKRWQRDRGRSTSFKIGTGNFGDFALDLTRDGPHGLVAGTTGSGKSELLQSMIASLAVSNGPDALNFVLVDYKGGSAFKDCNRLPHTVGMVTDLDAHLVERAITSLSAELRRREHVLAVANAKDIEDYLDIADRRVDLPTLPRLVIVIDEFASMARELPDFVTGLVNIAQRGRSLGIHLILATQRPSGVVSSEIRANTNLRIALRVTDASESTDVVDAADAAKIPKSAPGRGFARLGHAALLPFQAGRVGGRRPGDAGENQVVGESPFVVEYGWERVGYPAPEPAIEEGPSDATVTDLSILVAAIRDAAQSAKLPPQSSPWLEPLPERLLLDEITREGADGWATVPFGLEDLPEEQARRTACLDLNAGHFLVVGSARSGRSQVLRTIAGSIGRSHSPSDVHIYGIDCGNGALLPLTELPHCGAVVGRGQPERAARLLSRIKGELERRQTLLAGGGFADIGEQRRTAPDGQRLPHLVLLLDRWEGFTTTLAELDGGRLMNIVMDVFREGAGAGIHAVVAGDRSLATGRVGSLTDSKLALRLADRADYAFLGLNPRQLPDEIRPGLGFAAETATEVQVALLTADESGPAQAAEIVSIARRARDRFGSPEPKPFRVDELPVRLSFAKAWELRADDRDVFALAGVGGDELTSLAPDLTTTPCFIVAGPNRSGRTSSLRVMAESLIRSRADVLIAAPRRSALWELEGRRGVRGLISDAGASAEQWHELLGVKRKPLVVLMDDAESFKDSPVGESLRAVMKGASSLASALVLCGNAESICSGLSNWQVDAKKARQGLLLSPQSATDGDLIGLRLLRSLVGAPVQPGRGQLHLGDGSLITVTVPTV